MDHDFYLKPRGMDDDFFFLRPRGVDDDFFQYGPSWPFRTHNALCLVNCDQGCRALVALSFWWANLLNGETQAGGF